MYSACLGDSFAESPSSSVLYSFAMVPAGSATTSSYVIGAKRFRYISCGLVEFCLKALLNPAYVVLVVAYIVIDERDEPPASLLRQLIALEAEGIFLVVAQEDNLDLGIQITRADLSAQSIKDMRKLFAAALERGNENTGHHALISASATFQAHSAKRESGLGKALCERRMEERKVRLLFGCKGRGIGRDDASTSKRNMIEKSRVGCRIDTGLMAILMTASGPRRLPHGPGELQGRG